MQDRTYTVGQKSLELQAQEAVSRDPIELQREMLKDYRENLSQCINSFKKTCAGSFFIVVITKREPLMQNVLRNYFTARHSCPTPDYDQTVWHYISHDDSLHYLWSLPSRDACYHLKDNALYVCEEERSLLQHVLDFADGTLFKLAKKLNGESLKSPLIIG